jgi:hypothetical protein
VALEVNVALPVPEASAVMVTFCGVDQFDGVKVSVPPPVTDRPVFPELRAVVTVTFAVGAEDSTTASVPLAPCARFSALGVTVTVGAAVTVIPTGAEVVVAPWLS